MDLVLPGPEMHVGIFAVEPVRWPRMNCSCSELWLNCGAMHTAKLLALDIALDAVALVM
jgi:hypothetical protein